ncbi:prepilin peptidase CpaA [Mesobacillus persicus]|uniref:Prepilin peptidase CpaA n=1 Tax=Mesobacillus persicus TaxID=930146 RepID=A0A1H8CGT6_9BACI|nr:A24 family peptidase [Mesobacillus persicus]SEM94119.1 prepilin peptidase CpaA [Mesobacillus persicus]
MGSFILVLVLIISFFTDIKSRKILNIITLPTIIFGIIFNIYTGGVEGFFISGKGLLVGLGLLLIPYLLGGMGAGDVKLLTAIGALMGSSFVFYSFIYSALIGGAIALVLICKQKDFWQSMKKLLFNFTFFRGNLGSMVIDKNEKASRISFPYGVAIVLGTFCTLIWGGL